LVGCAELGGRREVGFGVPAGGARWGHEIYPARGRCKSTGTAHALTEDHFEVEQLAHEVEVGRDVGLAPS